ncbi:hypothetical protein [Nocardioides pinisoli]|uniref:2'-5' RNA ligase family protein n=1 Tax=Nocardioides pinisoli TaxID=2950279 RepID=A0ABT1KUC6_9ACTN|nr:hypothetical protein [Nocardioides pinisoli]MCP3421351.1 hypothetical protein [Nocardioides pinisoli]
MSAHVRSNPAFDRLLEDAIPALLAGAHRRDEPPVDGGRWPVSVVCVPDETTRDVLAGVMDEAVTCAGPGHFETGRQDASHFTVRALEPYRAAASAHEPVTDGWISSLEDVGRESPPVRLRLTGVTLSVGGVMVQAEPVDDGPWELMRRLRAALGSLAWFEDQVLAGSVTASALAAVVLRSRNRAYRRIEAEETADVDADGIPDVYER